MFRPKSGGSFAAKIAHTSTIPALGNQDLRSLQDLITTEKTVLTTLQKLATDMSRASDSLRAWGQGEGEDLDAILSSASTMYAHVITALNNFANHHHGVRAHLKDIRTREETLDEIKRKKKSVASKADAAEKKLTKMSGENKNLPAQTELLNKLRDEIRQLDTDIMVGEAKLGDFKRIGTRNFMALKLGGLLEFGEKATVIGELGKLLIEEIPLDPTPPGQLRTLFQGQTQVLNLVSEANRCIGEVVFSAPPEAILNTDAYVPPTSSSGNTRMLPPIEELRLTPEDTGTDIPGDLRVTNNLSSTTPFSTITANTTTSSSAPIAGLPLSSEFGESTDMSSRRFGTGPNPTSTGPKLGGQFSTFPVKTRSNSNATTGGLSLGGDFGSNMAGALGELGGDKANATNDVPSVTIEDSSWNGTTSVPSPTASGFTQSHNRAQSQESAYLAYDAPEVPTPERQDSTTGSMLNVERGVRFRTPSMEVTGMQPIAPGVASPVFPRGGSGWRSGSDAPEGAGGMARRIGESHGRTSNDVPPSPLSPPPEQAEDEYYSRQGQDNQGQLLPARPDDYYDPYDEYSRTPVSPNPYDRPDKENQDQEGGEPNQAELNAAAAREIQRELDAAIQVQPLLSSPQLAYQPMQAAPAQGTQGAAPIRPLEIHHRSPSPLAPPQAPFAQGRSPSPNSPNSGGYVSPTSGAQPPWAGNYNYGRTPPLPTSTSNAPETYSTPPEYPSSPSSLVPQPQSQLQTGSTTSLTSASVPTGGRTISAAAFKRKPGALPSSPYPANRQAQNVPAPIQPPPPGAARGQEPGSPVYNDYGSIGGTRITNAYPEDG